VSYVSIQRVEIYKFSPYESIPTTETTKSLIISPRAILETWVITLYFNQDYTSVESMSGYFLCLSKLSCIFFSRFLSRGHYNSFIDMRKANLILLFCQVLFAFIHLKVEATTGEDDLGGSIDHPWGRLGHVHYH